MIIFLIRKSEAQSVISRAVFLNIFTGSKNFYCCRWQKKRSEAEVSSNDVSGDRFGSKIMETYPKFIYGMFFQQVLDGFVDAHMELSFKQEQNYERKISCTRNAVWAANLLKKMLCFVCGMLGLGSGLRYLVFLSGFNEHEHLEGL